MGRPVHRIATTCYLKYPVYSKKYETCKETGKNDPHTRKKNQATETTCDSKQMSDLIGKDFKGAIIYMFKENKIMNEEAKKKSDNNVILIKSICKEIEIIENNQMEILELKSIITQIKIKEREI